MNTTFNIIPRTIRCRIIRLSRQMYLNPSLKFAKTDVNRAVGDFFADLREHDAADNVVMLLFSEFGRRVRDNGSGTDHGAAGAAFVIGDAVKGGQYGEFPSMKPEDLQQGDLVPNMDFRGLYTTVLEDWLGLEAKPIVKGNFEAPRFL